MWSMALNNALVFATLYLVEAGLKKLYEEYTLRLTARQAQTTTAAANWPISDLLSQPVILCYQVNAAVQESTSCKSECLEVSRLVDRLSNMLLSAARHTATYDRPLLRISGEVSKTLVKSLTLVRKCRRRSILSRVVAIVSAADFRKIVDLLESSVADMNWFLSIFESGGGNGIYLTLPPIASNEPILSWIWSYIACLYTGQLNDRVEAANELASLAKDNDRNKQIIVDEGGVSPLLKLLKDGSSLEGQIAAANSLLCLATDEDKVRSIVNCLMTITEITAAAESNVDLRREVFETNSPVAKAVVNHLLRVIKELDMPTLSIVAIKAIGSLARTFPARETRVLGPLVEQLSHRNVEVATEAAVSLGKFAGPENFLCVEHSETIIELNGVSAIMGLLGVNENAMLHGLILICYLAIHAGKSEDLERAGLLNIFKAVDRAFIAQHPELKELIAQATYHLSV